MPRNPGRKGENTTSARLAELLRDRGFPDADFERIFTIVDPITRKHAERKPDVVFTNGGTHIVSAKVGESQEREAISTATKYLRDLSPVTQLGEVFAVTYPRSGEKFHFHALPSGNHDEVPLVLDTLEELADAIVRTVQGRIREIEAHAETPLVEAGRILRYAATDLAASLTGVPEADLEEIFGGHDFFHSTLATVLQGKERKDALRLGASYLFVNQLLFYVLLSNAAARAGTPDLYPPIAPEDSHSPAKLRDSYFSRVRARDYEPIYGPDVARHLNHKDVGHAVEGLADTLRTLSPKLSVPELVGRVFQNLIPLKIRKPMGAHYTNPKSAHLLAKLAVRTLHASVMDPACGSGTLLVAAYREKRSLGGKDRLQDLHRQFVERELTGIDAMAFSCHLASVNLALQQPLLDTDYVRIGRADSTTLLPGMTIEPSGQSIPQKLQQRKLDEPAPAKSTKGQRPTVPALRRDSARSFSIPKVDVVMMNPPFTSQNNLAKDYRQQLKFRFQSPAAYREITFWKTSQQVYFCLLADRFLKDGGTLAAVLPFTTFTGRAFQPLVKYLATHYTVETIIVGLGRCAFSEDTSLTECLFVARKTPPPDGSTLQLVGVAEGPEKWTDQTAENILSLIRNGGEEAGLGIARTVHQADLLPEGEGLSTLFLRLNPEFEAAWQECSVAMAGARGKLLRFEELEERGVQTTSFYHGDVRPLQVGPRALVICRSEDRAIKNTDRLVLTRVGPSVITASDKDSPAFKVEYSPDRLSPCIRRFSLLDHLDITGDTDFIVNRPCPELTKAMHSFYTSDEASAYLRAIRESDWRGIIEHGSARVNVCTRVDLAAPGTRLFAFRSGQPAFLAGAYGYNVSGFSSEREERLFTMWFNSTVSLVQMLGKATITRGSWVKLEQYSTAGLLLPRFDALTEPQWQAVEELWSSLSKAAVPSLKEQLKTGAFREDLDVGLLNLTGMTVADAKALSAVLREGCLEAIEMLSRTMEPEDRGDNQDETDVE